MAGVRTSVARSDRLIRGLTGTTNEPPEGLPAKEGALFIGADGSWWVGTKDGWERTDAGP